MITMFQWAAQFLHWLILPVPLQPTDIPKKIPAVRHAVADFFFRFERPYAPMNKRKTNAHFFVIAEADCLREGHTTALYAVDVRDELGTYVAHATMNSYVIRQQ